MDDNMPMDLPKSEFDELGGLAKQTHGVRDFNDWSYFLLALIMFGLVVLNGAFAIMDNIVGPVYWVLLSFSLWLSNSLWHTRKFAEKAVISLERLQNEIDFLHTKIRAYRELPKT